MKNFFKPESKYISFTRNRLAIITATTGLIVSIFAVYGLINEPKTIYAGSATLEIGWVEVYSWNNQSVASRREFIEDPSTIAAKINTGAYSKVKNAEITARVIPSTGLIKLTSTSADRQLALQQLNITWNNLINDHEDIFETYKNSGAAFVSRRSQLVKEETDLADETGISLGTLLLLSLPLGLGVGIVIASASSQPSRQP